MTSNPDIEVLSPRQYEGCEPHDNMVFLSLEAASSFLNFYGKSHGFDVVIRTTRYFKESKEVSSRLFTCNRARVCRKRKTNGEVSQTKNTLTGRCDCPAQYVVGRKTPNSPWIIYHVRNVHNHDLASPRSLRNLRSHREMPLVAKNLVEAFSGAGLQTGKVPEVLDKEVGNFSKRDCYNHIRNVRKYNLDVGDADSVFKYCTDKKNQDPDFYYSILHDEEFRMTNFFWVDSRARLLYEEFGDVIVFDTTYKTNKYELPFGLFVGVNNYNQSTLFGCALLVDETEESYEWLFKTWLDAMRGKAPISMLTDQDKAIGKMVNKVFPSSTHRLCLWHIMKKIPEKYGHLYKTRSNFKHEMDKCLYQTWSTDEFDKRWKETMARYDLEEDEWLDGLYKIRSSWVPIYNRHVFFAGMTTTQRCEGMHAFFDGFVHKGTTLREFVCKYEKAIMARYIAENNEHFKCKHKDPFSELLPSQIAIHASTVYTRAILEKFVDEVKQGHLLGYVEKVTKEGSDIHYLVGVTEDSVAKFRVSISTSSWSATCECRLFEYQGILCRHILEIYHIKRLHQIPPQYILRRWTKEATEGIPAPLLVETNKNNLARNAEFHTQVSRLLPYLHKSEKSYQIIKVGMKRILDEVQELDGKTIEVAPVETEKIEVGQGSSQADNARLILEDPKVAKTKGRPKSSSQISSNGRFKSPLEISMKAKKKRTRKCRICREEGHNASTCPKANVSRGMGPGVTKEPTQCTSTPGVWTGGEYSMLMQLVAAEPYTQGECGGEFPVEEVGHSASSSDESRSTS